MMSGYNRGYEDAKSEFSGDVSAKQRKIEQQAEQITGLKEHNLMEYLVRQMAWSLRTFGDGRRTEGLCKHIELELAEIRAKPKDLEEWIDVIQLSLDGAWRAGHTPLAICTALESKLAKNQQRKWDVQKDESKPNLHIKAAQPQKGE